MVRPVAKFPGAVASDADLAVAINRVQTTLASGIGIADVSMTVKSAAGIVQNALLTIGTEIVRVSGPPAGNVIPISRGFDGTTAAAHTADSVISAYVDAWHHNAVIAEIMAIEATLGPNLGNASLPSPHFDFAAQAPGGNLGIGANVITMSPVPRGVNGSDTAHYLYISGGAGAAEACLIIGGAGRSGDPTGEIIVQCANTHTGAWTIKSATAGITEALNTGPTVFIPAGNHHVYASITLPVGVTLTGAGSGAYRNPATVLTFHSANTKLFNIVNDSFAIRDLSLAQDAGTPAVAGNAGIYTAGSGSGVVGATADWGLIENVTMSKFYNGIYAAGDGGSVDLNHVFIQLSVGDGAVALSAQGYWNAVIVQSSGGNGVTNGHAVPGGGVPPFFTGLQTYGNAGWGVYASNAFQITANSFLNNDRLGELYVSGTLGEMGYISDSYIQWSGVPYAGAPWVTNTTAPGILLDDGAGPITISNVHFYGCQGTAIWLKGGNSRVSDNRIIASGSGAQAGHIYSLKIEGASGLDEIVTGNDFRGPVSAATSGSVFRANWFQGSSAAPMLYFISGTNYIFDGNEFFQAGAGPAYQIDAGVTLQDGQNIVQAGTIVNNGTLSANAKQLFNYSAKASATAHPAVSAATATWTSIPFDTNGSGFNAAMHSTSVDPTRFTAPVAGLYIMTGQATITAGAGGTVRQARILKNGTTPYGPASGVVSATITAQPVVLNVTYLAAGDYVELQAYQDSGGPLDVLGTGFSYFSMLRIGN